MANDIITVANVQGHLDTDDTAWLNAEYVASDQDMLLCQKDNFVHTDSEIGITEKDVERAIEILNKQNSNE